MRSLFLLLLLLSAALSTGCVRKSGAEGTTDSVATSDSGARRRPVERMNPAIRVDSPAPAIPIDGDTVALIGSVRRGERGVIYKIVQGRTTLLEGKAAASGPVDGDTLGRLRFEARFPMPKVARQAPQGRDARTGRVMLTVELDGGDTGHGGPRVMMPLVTSDTAGQDRGFFNVYMRNPSMGDPKVCDAVQPLQRIGPKDLRGRMLVALLVRGPSPQEMERGYRTELPPGAVARGYKEDNGTALVDFNAEMSRVTDACARTAVRSQIEKTLLQIPGITSVKITVQGQPFQ